MVQPHFSRDWDLEQSHNVACPSAALFTGVLVKDGVPSTTSCPYLPNLSVAFYITAAYLSKFCPG